MSTSFQTQDFFSDAMQGVHAPRQGLLPDHISQDPDHQSVYETMRKYYGPFDEHIETSIPDFRSNTLDKVHALAKMPPGRFLDIAGSTGSTGKALAELGGWQTDNLDPNPEMVAHHKQTPVPGANIIPQAFGEGFDDVPAFEPSELYDVVHESMGFQFIGSDRDAQVATAKSYLKPGGLFLTEEKFHTDNEEEHERIKDEEFKSLYYDTEQLDRKNQEVGFQGQGPMTDNLVHHRDYEETLRRYFRYVEPYWQSGNFMGYAASDSQETLSQFLGGLKRRQTESLRQANILDPVSDTLPPEVWDDPGSEFPTFKPQHKKWLMNTAIEILHKGGYEGIEDYVSFVVTGSIATYQYSDRSDVDTSLFIDFERFPEWSRAEIIGLFVDELDGVKLPGTPYDVQIFVQPPDIKPEDIFKPGLRSGYLLDEDRWLVPPDRSRARDIEKEMNDVYTYALETADKMDRLLTYEPQKAVMFWHQLHRRRKRDMQAHKGDFAPSNVAYKFVVNRGLTSQLEEIMGKKIVL